MTFTWHERISTSRPLLYPRPPPATGRLPPHTPQASHPPLPAREGNMPSATLPIRHLPTDHPYASVKCMKLSTMICRDQISPIETLHRQRGKLMLGSEGTKILGAMKLVAAGPSV